MKFFNVKLPTIWTDGKAEVRRVREEKGRRRSEKRKSQKKEAPGARKGGKVAKHCVFFNACDSGSKSRLAKAAGAEPSGEMRNQKLHALVAQSKFEVKKTKKASRPEHFWKLRSKKCTRLWREAHFEVQTCKQLQLHYNYNYNYNCTTPHYIQQLWLRWPLQPLQKHNSNHLSVHQWMALTSMHHHNSPLR